MSQKFKKLQNKNNESTAYGKWFATAVYDQHISERLPRMTAAHVTAGRFFCYNGRTVPLCYFLKRLLSVLSPLFLLHFRHKAGYEAVGDGGTYPDLREHIVGKFVDRLQIDGDIIKCGNEDVYNADDPQVALGVALPVLAGIEEGEHAEQQHRERETRQVKRIESQGRREEDVAQQHRHTHRYGAPVVELLGGDAVVEEIHPDHHQTGDVEQVENQFGPCLGQPEMKHAIEHHDHRQYSRHGSDDDVENLGILFESCLHN